MRMKKVAIVGAGAAGLTVARHLTKYKNICFDVFEKSSSVGGVWEYTDFTHQDKYGLKVHSAMYKNLRTNLAKETMAFPDYPFNESIDGSFLIHKEIVNYLRDYADHFNVTPQIRFQTNVEKIKMVKEENNNEEKWKIDFRYLDKEISESTTYDAVFVCNGHYAIPNYPKFATEKFFKGSIIHSHSYRSNEPFIGKRVILLGARASGTDIALDISKVAFKVYISHRRNPLVTKFPENVSQVPAIKEFKEDGETVILSDDKEIQADSIVYCTGYQYEFPFLDENCEINVDDNRVTWLYNHIINAKHPNMALIGICARNLPFPQFHCQAQYAISVMFGDKKLPPLTQMIEEIEQDYDKRIEKGLKKSEAHVMEDRQWEYNDGLAELGGFEKIPLYVRQLYDHVTTRRRNFIREYKNDIYKIENGEFKTVYNQDNYD